MKCMLHKYIMIGFKTNFGGGKVAKTKMFHFSTRSTNRCEALKKVLSLNYV